MFRTALPLTLATLFLVDGIALAAAPAVAKRLTPAHRITGVTVYQDRALVTRSARLELAPGSYEIRVANLPSRLTPDSLRVGGHGTAKVVLHGFDLRTVYLGEAPQEKLRQLTKERETVRDQDRTLSDRWLVQSRQKQSMEALTNQLADQLARQLGNSRAKVADWQATLGFVQTRLQGAISSMQQIEIWRRDLAQRATELDTKLRQVQSYRQTESRLVPVNVEVQRGGTFDLDVTYAIGGARWVPSHEAQLMADGKKLTWRAFGMVSQQTGEDWTNVAMKLSTARPSTGGSAPVLSDWPLRIYVPQPVYSSGDMMDDGPGRGGGAMAKSMRAAPAAPPQKEAADEEAKPTEAAVVDQGTSVTLGLADPVTIPSDGQPHQTPLGQFEVASVNRYKVVPKVDEAVYLDATITNPAAWPLLMGVVRTYIDTTFVGNSHLSAPVAHDQKLDLGMGVDDSLSVKRTRTKRQASESGLITKDRVWDYQFRIVVKNNKGTAQTVTVVEPLPRPDDQAIKVTVAAVSPKPMDSADDDRLTWQLLVPAHTEKVIDWGYRVQFNKDLHVTGLE